MNTPENRQGIQTDSLSVANAKGLTNRLNRILIMLQTNKSLLSSQEQQMRRLFPSYRLPQEPKYPSLANTRFVGSFIVGDKPLNLRITNHKNSFYSF